MENHLQKKIFIVFILVVFCFLLYWVFQSVFPSIPPSVISRPISSTSTDSLFQENSLNPSGVYSSSTAALPNLTSGVITDASKDLLSSLQLASSTSKEDLLDALKNSATSSINEALLQKYMNPEQIGLVISVPDLEIKIVKDSETSLATYAKGYRDALLSFSDVNMNDISSALDAFLNTRNTSELDSLLQKYENVNTILRTLQVPQSRVSFHKKNLVYFGDMASVLRSIRVFDSDPMRAYIAIQYLPQVVAQWEPISNEIIKYK